MKKHTLDLDSIAVETFSTGAQPQVEFAAVTLRTCPTQEINCTSPVVCG
jgi:hypothetical protein